MLRLILVVVLAVIIGGCAVAPGDRSGAAI
jgi:hypothetical protein